MLPFRPVVRTGKPGYSYLYDSSGGSYIYIKHFLLQTNARLVVNTDTGQVVIQKIVDGKRLILPPNPLIDPSDLVNMPEDREVRIVAYLHSFVQNLPSLTTELTPRWITCISHDDTVPATSYWNVYNGGLLRDYGEPATDPKIHKPLFPVSLVARCISQVCETLHVMYHAGPEAVYHGDFTLDAFFLHFDPLCQGPLPDFYVANFAYSKTATEALLDTQLRYGSEWGRYRRILPRIAPLGQRRRWDIETFIHELHRHCNAVDSKSEQAVGLQRLMALLTLLDDQDRDLAARDPNSRPPSLLEVVQEAKKLEMTALAVEQYTEQFKASIARGRAKAKKDLKADKPFVFRAANKASAEKFGRRHLYGNFRVIESV
jgi:hypothetical protein